MTLSGLANTVVSPESISGPFLFSMSNKVQMKTFEDHDFGGRIDLSVVEEIQTFTIQGEKNDLSPL